MTGITLQSIVEISGGKTEINIMVILKEFMSRTIPLKIISGSNRMVNSN